MSNNLQDLRTRLRKKAEDAIENGSRNPLDFIPKIGKTNVRFFPAKDENDLFYHTHAYHYIPGTGENGKGGKFVYTPRRFKVDGVEKEDPIDVAVREWYNAAEKNNDGEIKKIASTLKRKRHYFFHGLLVDETDITKKYRVIQDRSNDGKLARVICVTMGLPFFKDVEDQWVDQTSLEIDEDKDYFDLISPTDGHDFSIKMAKDGDNSWDITYADSFAQKKVRKLDEEEMELFANRIDLKTYVPYEMNYAAVEQILNEYIDSLGKKAESEDEEKAQESAPKVDKEQKEEMKEIAKKAAKKPAAQTKEEAKDIEGDVDEMLSELDDEE